jgi:hypothetical protein
MTVKVNESFPTNSPLPIQKHSSQTARAPGDAGGKIPPAAYTDKAPGLNKDRT